MKNKCLPGSSTYSSEAEDSQVTHPTLSLDEVGHSNSSNPPPSHTLGHHSSQEAGENLSNSIWYDEFDSSGLDPVAKQKALDQFQAKMTRSRSRSRTSRTVAMKMWMNTSGFQAAQTGSNFPVLNKFLRRKTRNLPRILLSFRKNLKTTKERSEFCIFLNLTNQNRAELKALSLLVDLLSSLKSFLHTCLLFRFVK